MTDVRGHLGDWLAGSAGGPGGAGCARPAATGPGDASCSGGRPQPAAVSTADTPSGPSDSSASTAGTGHRCGRRACCCTPRPAPGPAGSSALVNRPGRRGWADRGLVGLRPELQAVDPLTATLAMVDVRWAYLDEAGTARQHSRYRYLLRRSDSGQLAIQVVIDTTPTLPDRDGRDWSQSVELPACPCVGGHPVPPPGNSGHPDATPALGAKLLVRGGLRRCGEPGR
jgi:hypothetical protein